MPDNTLELLKTALGKPSDEVRQYLAKAIGTYTLATNLVPFDLTAPSKNLYPVAAPLRNRIPRRGGGEGKSTNWKKISAITGSGYDAMGWVPEGQRSGSMSVTESDVAAIYVTLGEEESSTYEAQSGSVGFEDVRATGTMRMLQKMMLKEEAAIFGGNRTNALGTVGTVTTSAGGSGGTLAAITYSCICVALTYEGYRNSSVANGVATSQVITGNDGQSYTLKGGSSMKSAAASQNVTSGQSLSLSVAPVTGAVAYAWYIGLVGSETLQAITTINSVIFSKAVTAGTQPATQITADNSANTVLSFDGLIPTAFNGGGYVNTLATGTAGTGTVLTSSGRGGVAEIDTMLKSMWDLYQVSPDVLYVNSQQMQDITSRVLSTSTAPLLRYNKDSSGGDGYRTVANGVVEFYFNPFSLQGGQKIPIEIHPNAPPGTIIAWTDRLPPQYQSNNTPTPVEMRTRREYYQIDWPITTRANYQGVYVEEVLAFYAPFAMGLICNIAAG